MSFRAQQQCVCSAHRPVEIIGSSPNRRLCMVSFNMPHRINYFSSTIQLMFTAGQHKTLPNIATISYYRLCIGMVCISMSTIPSSPSIHITVKSLTKKCNMTKNDVLKKKFCLAGSGIVQQFWGHFAHNYCYIPKPNFTSQVYDLTLSHSA